MFRNELNNRNLKGAPIDQMLSVFEKGCRFVRLCFGENLAAKTLHYIFSFIFPCYGFFGAMIDVQKVGTNSSVDGGVSHLAALNLALGTNISSYIACTHSTEYVHMRTVERIICKTVVLQVSVIVNMTH